MLRSLERIETGAAGVPEARALLQAVIKAHADEEGASEVFGALRSWTGRMLRASLTSEDLRAWHGLFKAAAAQFRGELRDYSVRINVLAELVYERVGMAESRTPEIVLSRRHVRAILAEMGSAPHGRVARAALGQALAIEQANLTRVCTMMVDAGMIARIEDGRTVAFELTGLGAAHVRAGGSAGRSAAGDPAAIGSWHGPSPTEVAVGALPSTEPSTEEWSHFDVQQDVIWESRAA